MNARILSENDKEKSFVDAESPAKSLPNLDRKRLAFLGTTQGRDDLFIACDRSLAFECEGQLFSITPGRRFDDASVKKPKTCRDVADVAKSFGRSLETSTCVTRERKFAQASNHNKASRSEVSATVVGGQSSLWTRVVDA